MYSHTFIKIQFTVCLSTPAVPFGNQRWYFAAWPSFESWLAKMSGGLQHSFLQQCHAFFQVTSERQHPAWQPCKHDPARGPVQLPCAYARDNKDLWRPCWPLASLAPTSFSSVGELGAGSAAWGRMPSTAAPSLFVLTLLHQNRKQRKKMTRGCGWFSVATSSLSTDYLPCDFPLCSYDALASENICLLHLEHFEMLFLGEKASCF